MPVRPVLAFVAAFVCPANDSRFEGLYAVLKFSWRLSVAGTTALCVLTMVTNCRLLPLHCAVCFSFLHEQTGPPTHPEILSFPCVHWHGALHRGSLGYLTLAAWSACGMQCLFVLCLLLLLHLSALRTTAGLNNSEGVLGHPLPPQEN